MLSSLLTLWCLAADGGVTLDAPAYTVREHAAVNDTLRFTAELRERAVTPLPFSIDLPKASTARLQVSADDGGFTLTADHRRVARITFEAGDGALAAQFDFDGATTFHGLGQTAPVTALRNERFELIHTPKFGSQTWLYIPFFFTDSGLGVYVNASSGDLVTLKHGSTARVTTSSGRLDFYVFGPSSPQNLVAEFYRLSSSRSLLPRWAYGYLQSRFGYRDEEEVRRTVAMASRFEIPLSAIVLDLYWFRRMGDLDWNPEKFPDPKALDEWLEQHGVKLVTISEPFIARDSKHFGELEDAGALAHRADGGTALFSDWWDFGQAGGGIIDPTRASTRERLARTYANLAKAGVDGFWTDLGEPERVPGTTWFGSWTEGEYHDFFNLNWAHIVRDGFTQARPGQRPFILSRSGWTGIAGLGVSTWSGDVPSTWDGLQAQVPLGLGASVSGLPFWGSDVGGFVSEGGELMPPDPELALRWHQFGAFTPVYRAHGHGAREPWIYGPVWLERIKKVITWRMALLPYVYSTAWQTWDLGVPMMRPLYFVEPEVPRWHEEEEEFLLGDSVLVAPVLQPLSASTKKVVRLPRGGWYEAETLRRVEGDQTLDLTLESEPVYFREGAIIPLHRRGDAVLLLPGPQPTRFTWFDDDGLTEAYRRGEGEKLVISLSRSGVTFTGATRAHELTLLLPKTLTLRALARRAEVDGPYQSVKVSVGKGVTHVDW